MINLAEQVEALGAPAAAADHASATNAPAVVTYDAIVTKKHRITQIIVGYDSEPQEGSTVKIQDGGVTIFELPITAAGAAPIPFVDAYDAAARNATMVVTLSDGGADCTGYVNVRHKTF